MTILTKSGIKTSSYVYHQMRLLQTVLLWPIKTEKLFLKIIVHLYCWFICITLIVSSICLFVKASLTNDLVDRSEAIDIMTLTFSAFYKFTFFIMHHSGFKRLVDSMDDEFPKMPMIGHSTLTMKIWMRLSGPLSYLHCLGAFITVGFWGVCPLLTYLFRQTTWEDMPLPMNVWYPFDYGHGILFNFLYFLHLSGLIISGQIYMACDGFLFSLVYFACGQIELIKRSLHSIKDIHSNENESIDVAQHNAFKKCVEQHAKLKLFLKEVDVIFRSMIVADVLHAIISLSFAMFQTSEAKGVLGQMKMIIFVSYCFVHQYLNSAFGQFLINQQESLLIEVYGVNWVDRSIPFRKSVHIMMGGGCIKPVRLSAWRMYFLQYETFVEFCRSMVSFFMVLRTMQDQGMIEM